MYVYRFVLFFNLNRVEKKKLHIVFCSLADRKTITYYKITNNPSFVYRIGIRGYILEEH